MRYLSVCSGIEAATVAEKPCAKCGETKPLEQFHRQPKGPHGRHSYCAECACAVQRESRKRNYTPEQKRRWQIKTRYGMSTADVDAMLADQGGKCGICARKLEKFHIDHHHDTGAVRGLLCHRCNLRIGGWDDAVFRAAALAWLER